MRIRVLAIAGGLAALAAALFFFMMMRAQPAVVDTTGSLEAERALGAQKAGKSAAPAKPQAKKPAAPASGKQPKPSPAPAAQGGKPVIAPKPSPVPAAAAPELVNGLPAAVSRALAGNTLVIVSLYVPGARVDALAAAEAEAGAKALGIGFVRVNVLDEESSRPLVEKLGVLQNPSVLVFDSDGDLRARLEGFVDRQTVAQAALSSSGTS